MSEVDRRYEQFQAVIARNTRELADLKSLVLARLGPLSGAGGFRPGVPIYYTSNDTFTKANFPGLRALIVECQGAGGGGGGCAATGAGVAAMASGGAGGTYAKSLVLVSDLDTTEAITVGGGGGGGSAGNNAGTDGGSSVFDTISGSVTGEGGGGGLGSGAAGASGSSGRTAGSVASSVGDLLLQGEDGTGSLWRNAGVDLELFGGGGGSFLGQARMSNFTSNAGSGGLAGVLYGGGGSGGYNYPSQSARSGGDGANGIVIVTPLY